MMSVLIVLFLVVMVIILKGIDMVLNAAVNILMVEESVRVSGSDEVGTDVTKK